MEYPVLRQQKNGYPLPHYTITKKSIIICLAVNPQFDCGTSRIYFCLIKATLSDAVLWFEACDTIETHNQDFPIYAKE